MQGKRKPFALLMMATLIAGASVIARQGVESSTGTSGLISSDERGVVALDQTLRELTNPFTVMCVAHSPNGIDDGTLAYYHKRLGARVVIVLATRGEGEPTSTAGDYGNALGALRTREALDSARLIGADVYFLNLRHAGPAKSADEVLALWGHQEATLRLSTAMRLLRPDVLITMKARADDGYQQALSRLLLEMLNGSASQRQQDVPDPDQWQPSRWYEETQEQDASVTVELDEYDRVRGRSYADIGLEARRRRASYVSHLDRLTTDLRRRFYRQVGSAAEAVKTARQKSMLDDLQIPENLSASIKPPLVRGAPVLEAIGLRDALVESLKETLHEKRLEAAAESFRERYGAHFHRAARYTETLERALAIALGLEISISLSDDVLVRGQKVTARITLKNGSPQPVSAVLKAPNTLPIGQSPPEMKAAEPTGATPGGVTSMEIEYETPAGAPYTLPQAERLYDERYYAVGSALPGAQPAAAFGNRMLIVADVLIGEVSIPVAAATRFDVVPFVEVDTIPFALVKNWETPRDIEIHVRLKNRTAGALTGTLWVVPLALAKDDYEPVRLTFTKQDEETVVKLKLTLPVLKPPLSPDMLLEFRREPATPSEPLGSARIVIKAGEFDITEGIRVGYIKGPGNWLPRALTALGVEHKEITEEHLFRAEHGNITPSDTASDKPAESSRLCGGLNGIDTLIIDDDAVALRPGLTACNPCLLEYAKRGGNLVVLRQRADDWNLILCGSRFAPYPLALSAERIASEAAAVKIVDDAHPIVTSPNKLTPKDFEGWSFERASSVALRWADEYSGPLETGDPGEDARRGVLLVARHGEGSFIYLSLALRPQLSDGNAGAFRLLANLISFAKVTRQGESPR